MGVSCRTHGQALGILITPLQRVSASLPSLLRPLRPRYAQAPSGRSPDRGRPSELNRVGGRDSAWLSLEGRHASHNTVSHVAAHKPLRCPAWHSSRRNAVARCAEIGHLPSLSNSTPPRAGGARAAERLRAATPVPGFQAARALAGRPGAAPLVAASMMLHGCRRAALPESARARPHLAVVTGASG